MNKPTNKLVELLLCIFLGWAGAHKFYVGKTILGVVYLFTFGLFGFGWILDIVLLLVGFTKLILISYFTGHFVQKKTILEHDDLPNACSPKSENTLSAVIEPVLPTYTSSVPTCNKDDSYLSYCLTEKLEQPIECSPIKSTDFSRYGGPDAELLTIDLMVGHDFEYWTADMLRDLGYSNVEVTRGSGDQGVDVLAEKDSIKYAIQCKRYTSNLGNKPVQEVYAGKTLYNCHVGVVITNQYFTDGAKQLANATGILLWDRDYIKHYLEQHALTPSESFHIKGKVDDCDLMKYYPYAVQVVVETKQASVSMLERRLKLGYAQSAKLIDQMEANGIIGPFNGTAPRKILISPKKYLKYIP